MPTETEAKFQRAQNVAGLPLESVGVRKSGAAGTLASLRHIWAYRELLDLLVRRELKVRYKDSALGFAWSLLRPLSMLLVYYLAIGKFLGAERSIPSFAIYLFTGLTAWTLFAEIFGGASNSIVHNGGLIKKIYLPREVFPLSVVGSALFNFFVQMAILLAATLLVGQFPNSRFVLLAPLALLVLLVYGFAFGLMVSAINVYLRDVGYLVEIVLMVWFWFTPVVYSWQLVQATLGPVAEQIYLASPPTAAVLAFQKAFWMAGGVEATPPDLGQRLLIMLAIGLVLLWLAQRVFSRLEGNFAQEL